MTFYGISINWIQKPCGVTVGTSKNRWWPSTLNIHIHTPVIVWWIIHHCNKGHYIFKKEMLNTNFFILPHTHSHIHSHMWNAILLSDVWAVVLIWAFCSNIMIATFFKFHKQIYVDYWFHLVDFGRLNYSFKSISDPL